MGNEHNELWAATFAGEMQVPTDHYARPFSNKGDFDGQANDALALSAGTSPLATSLSPQPASREDAHAEWDSQMRADLSLALGQSPDPVGIPTFSGKNSADMAIEAADEVARDLVAQFDSQMSNDSIFGFGDDLEAAVKPSNENESVGRIDMSRRNKAAPSAPSVAKALKR